MDIERSPIQLTVTPELAHTRLDRYVVAVLPDLSRSYVQQLIEDAHIRVNDGIAKASYVVRPDDRVQVTLPLPKPSDIEPQDLPLTLVYEDDDVVVVDKPSGMVVHPAPGHATGTLVNALIYHYPAMRIGDDLRPGIIHRLDRDTSGLLVVAKHDRAKSMLQAQQQARQMLKVYQALIHGRFKEPQGVIDAPIGRHPSSRLRMAIVEDGRSARTHYRTLELLGPYSLVEAKLETGRTHQIRVHFSHKHHPVVGDPLYGSKEATRGLKRQFLHACRLGFARLDGQWIECEAALPAELQEVLDSLRLQFGSEPVQGFNAEEPWWQRSEA